MLNEEKKMLFSILKNPQDVPSAPPMNRFKRHALNGCLRIPNILYLVLQPIPKELK